MFTWIVPLSCSSKKQLVVALPSCEAEYFAIVSSACQAIWLKILIKETHYLQNEPTLIYIDNMLAIALAKSLAALRRSMHIDKKYRFI